MTAHVGQAEIEDDEAGEGRFGFASDLWHWVRSGKIFVARFDTSMRDVTKVRTKSS
ncbi:hypothetical protein [Methylobacterium sp. SD21]|uniref:hypothetical protein n=1 Tax=Methylobacterium litchii TaxID=3138810 RepID=UPI00313BE3D7